MTWKILRPFVNTLTADDKYFLLNRGNLTEINDFKSYHAVSKKGLNSLNNEFIECLKESLNVTDNLIKIDNDILMA